MAEVRFGEDKKEVKQDRIDKILRFGEYRKTIMALKWLRWEIERMIAQWSAGLGEESWSDG